MELNINDKNLKRIGYKFIGNKDYKIYRKDDLTLTIVHFDNDTFYQLNRDSFMYYSDDFSDEIGKIKTIDDVIKTEENKDRYYIN